MQVTPHFALSEFSQPARHGQPAAPYPQEWLQERLQALCQLLEVLRAHLGGQPITVLSGYRSEAYNKAIGGAPQSQHCQGRAADIQVMGCLPAEVHDAALLLHRMGKIRLGGLGRYPGFTHVDIRPGGLVRWDGSRTEN